MLESMWAEIDDEKTWAAFVKKFAGGGSVSKLVSQRAERSHDFAKVHRRDAAEGRECARAST